MTYAGEQDLNAAFPHLLHLASTLPPKGHALASVNCFTSRGFACADPFVRNSLLLPLIYLIL